LIDVCLKQINDLVRMGFVILEIGKRGSNPRSDFGKPMVQSQASEILSTKNDVGEIGLAE
jgi:hypothetical protein